MSVQIKLSFETTTRASPEFNDREHFLRAAALAMRHVLVSHARERLAIKRGGGDAAIALLGKAPASEEFEIVPV